jgi:hypothetical protein
MESTRKKSPRQTLSNSSNEPPRATPREVCGRRLAGSQEGSRRMRPNPSDALPMSPVPTETVEMRASSTL